MSWFRRTLPRKPHPDGRAAARLEDIRALRRRVEKSAHTRDNSGSWSEAERLMAQSATLRKERDGLEGELAPLHDEISKRLADLGEDAWML